VWLQILLEVTNKAAGQSRDQMKMTLFTGTWNCGDHTPAADLAPWLKVPPNCDIVAIGVQVHIVVHINHQMFLR
jgi:hypothetical protein